MTGRAALLAAIVALGAPAAASAESTTISMPGKYFDPPRSTMVAGDEVVFRNNDLVTHDVRIGGGAFDSGPIARFTSWSQRIDQPGGYSFACTLHAFMSGNVDVVAATLGAAPDGVLAGEPLTLSGRAPAGTARVAVERSMVGGEWTATGAGAAPAADGTFAAKVPAAEGASYRVTTPAGASPAVTPRVTARVNVRLHMRRSRRQAVVHVQTKPATAGFVATLELYARWRYRWRSQRSVELDSRGSASFRLPASSRSFARVALRRKRGGPALVHSGVVKLRTGRHAADPDSITPSGPGGQHPGHG